MKVGYLVYSSRMNTAASAVEAYAGDPKPTRELTEVLLGVLKKDYPAEYVMAMIEPVYWKPVNASHWRFGEGTYLTSGVLGSEPDLYIMVVFPEARYRSGEYERWAGDRSVILLDEVLY